MYVTYVSQLNRQEYLLKVKEAKLTDLQKLSIQTSVVQANKPRGMETNIL